METVVLNIRGTKFEISIGTFQKLMSISNSRFYKEAIVKGNSNGEYYLERSPEVCSAVLQFLVNKELHLPQNVCAHLFLTEIEFWGLKLNDVKKCCRNTILNSVANQHILDEYDEYFNDSGTDVKANTFRSKVWITINDPSYSKAAKVYVLVALFFIVLSIFIMTAESHPYFQRKLSETEWKDFFNHAYDDEDYDHENQDEENNHADYEDFEKNINKTLPRTFVPVEYLVIMEYVVCVYFTFDTLLRFLICFDKLRFFLDLYNIVDIIALMAAYAHFFVEAFVPNQRYKDDIVDTVRAFQILRILRFLRILKRIRGFRVLAYSFKTGYKEFLLVLTFLFLGAITFGSLIYFLDDKRKFLHIPNSMYWAIVTLTTVGYGDVYPNSFQGKFIACTAAICGALLLAAMIPIFVNNFMFFYSHKGEDTDKLTENKQKKSKEKEMRNRKFEIQMIHVKQNAICPEN